LHQLLWPHLYLELRSRLLEQTIVLMHRRYHQPFSITWLGSPEYPDLITFPFLKNVEVSSVHQSYEIAAIWKDSTILDYGSHASIRITEHHRFPIMKLAHSNDLSIKLIQYEFDILVELAKLGLPVVEIDQQPVLDNGIACGYRIKSSPSSNHPSYNRELMTSSKHSIGFILLGLATATLVPATS